jgi:hypothetical protein
MSSNKKVLVYYIDRHISNIEEIFDLIFRIYPPCSIAKLYLVNCDNFKSELNPLSFDLFLILYFYQPPSQKGALYLKQLSINFNIPYILCRQKLYIGKN